MAEDTTVPLETKLKLKEIAAKYSRQEEALDGDLDATIRIGKYEDYDPRTVGEIVCSLCMCPVSYKNVVQFLREVMSVLEFDALGVYNTMVHNERNFPPELQRCFSIVMATTGTIEISEQKL